MLVVNHLSQEDVDRMDVLDAVKTLEEIAELATELMSVKAMLHTKIENYERTMGSGVVGQNPQRGQ
jgi:hypothetical protein